MAILEVGIVFKTTNLITKKFYNSPGVISTEIRNNILEAVYNLTNKSTLQNVSFGKFILLIQSSRLVNSPDEEEEEEDNLLRYIPPLEITEENISVSETQEEEVENDNKIQIYTLIEQNTKIKSVQENMNELLLQFLNKYSIYDITQKNIKKFKGFSNRFAEVFQDLAMNSEDRFKAIF